MSFGSCPTVRIVADNDDGFMDINESDFDEKVHEKYAAPKPKAAPKKNTTKKAPAKKG